MLDSGSDTLGFTILNPNDRVSLHTHPHLTRNMNDSARGPSIPVIPAPVMIIVPDPDPDNADNADTTTPKHQGIPVASTPPNIKIAHTEAKRRPR